MADILRVTGGAVSIVPGTSWTSPNGMFTTQQRNDGSAYSWSSSLSRVAVPSSDLADGYLIVASMVYEDTSNGRQNPQLRITQESGTGTFVGSPTGGYNRDTSEDQSYVRCWGFIDNPSADAQFRVEWKRDTDTPTGGTLSSVVEVIPFYYSDIGLYSSTSASLYGGTTPNQVTGWSGTDGTNITLSGDVITVAGDNKRYLTLASQFFEGRGGRTQRWHGLDIDGSEEHAAKACSYYRNTANDESGDLFTHLLATTTANRTIEQTCYRGAGVAASQGGADIDGSTPAVGDHALVVIELTDSTEVFFSSSNADSPNVATTGPVDLSPFPSANFTGDSASFTRASDSAVNAEVDMDALLGANVSFAQNTIGTALRWTAYSEFTVDGTEDSDTVAGDYMRSNQGSQDTFGASANLLSFVALSANEDIGLSVTELAGTEGGADSIDSNSGWTGIWGINLDTMQDTGGASAIDGSSDLTITPSGSISASGDLAGTTNIAHSVTGALSSVGSLSGSTALSLSASGSAVGGGDLQGSSPLSLSLTGSMSSDSSMQGTVDLSLSASGSLDGQGTLAGILNGLSLSPSVTILSTGSGTGSPMRCGGNIRFWNNAFQYFGYVYPPAQVASSITGDVNLLVTPSASLGATGSLAGSISLSLTSAATGSTSSTKSGAGRLLNGSRQMIFWNNSFEYLYPQSFVPSNDGAMVGTVALDFSPTAQLDGTGNLQGTVALSLTPTGTLFSDEISGTVSMSFSNTGQLAAVGSLAGTCSLSLTGTASVSDGLSRYNGTVIPTKTNISFWGGSTLRYGKFPSVYIPAITGQMQGMANLAFTNTGSLSSLAPAQGQVDLSFTPTGLVQSKGVLEGSISLSLAPSGDIEEDQNMAGVAALSFQPTGSIAAIGSIQGTCSLSLSTTATLNIPIGFIDGLGIYVIDDSIPSSSATLYRSPKTKQYHVI
jgi:hypothetical protein